MKLHACVQLLIRFYVGMRGEIYIYIKLFNCRVIWNVMKVIWIEGAKKNSYWCMTVWQLISWFSHHALPRLSNTPKTFPAWPVYKSLEVYISRISHHFPQISLPRHKILKKLSDSNNMNFTKFLAFFVVLICMAWMGEALRAKRCAGGGGGGGGNGHGHGSSLWIFQPKFYQSQKCITYFFQVKEKDMVEDTAEDAVKFSWWISKKNR